jgi:hypothetical protein
MFGIFKPKNRVEDIQAAKDLVAEDEVLQDDPHAQTMINNAEANSEVAEDIGDALAERREVKEDMDARGVMGAAEKLSTEKIINPDSSMPEDNN